MFFLFTLPLHLKHCMVFNSRPADQHTTSSGITKNAEGHSAEACR